MYGSPSAKVQPGVFGNFHFPSITCCLMCSAARLLQHYHYKPNQLLTVEGTQGHGFLDSLSDVSLPPALHCLQL
jgi:hypothetical protein